MSEKSMSMKEALAICEKALAKHKGGRAMFLRIIEILEEYQEERECEDEEIY